jgi:hypothetical protein
MFILRQTISDGKQSTSFAGHFDSHGSALVQLECIAQCSMSRATPEATGFRHWATTHPILPQRWPRWQQTKQQWKIAPTLLAFLMAVAGLVTQAVTDYTCKSLFAKPPPQATDTLNSKHQVEIRKHQKNKWNEDKRCVIVESHVFVQDIFSCATLFPVHHFLSTGNVLRVVM